MQEQENFKTGVRGRLRIEKGPSLRDKRPGGDGLYEGTNSLINPGMWCERNTTAATKKPPV